MAGLTPLTQGQDAIRSIDELLETLPQELYDMIYKRTFTASSGGVVSLKDGNAFPSLLHVDHQTREDFAESFYRNTTFTFGGKLDRPANAQDVDLWAQRIATHHLQHVNKLILKIDKGYGCTESYQTDPKTAADVKIMVLWTLNMTAADLGNLSHHLVSVLRVWYGLSDGQGVLTESFATFKAKCAAERAGGVDPLQLGDSLGAPSNIRSLLSLFATSRLNMAGPGKQTAQLGRLLHALPQEIFDEIHRLTFYAADFSGKISIDKDYKPPSVLAVDRSTRGIFAPLYYSQVVFTTCDERLFTR